MTGRKTLRAIAAEPFFHFLILGGLIYGGVELARPTVASSRIVMAKDRIGQIAATYEQQYGAPPAAGELKALVDASIAEEIYYREGIALGLDRDDEIVRRRIAQKYRFLHDDLDIVAPPSPADLQAFFDAHRNEYTIPEQLSFTHVYFSEDRDGAAGAQSRAQAALKVLQAGNIARAPEIGDRFPDQYDYASLVKTEIVRLFGENEFSNGLLAAPAGQWAGPYRSGYGWHLIRVTSRSAARVPALSEIEDRVRANLVETTRRANGLKSLERLRAKYQIVDAASPHG
jgi:peptidyl-prolyl cis-trans isomerase C